MTETTTGRVRGLELDGLLQFRGIPFAAPPIGARRFLPPGPVEPWEEVRAAEKWGPAPPQPDLILPAGARTNEDCLQLNVFTPALEGARRPVMVWFYGGGFTMGSTQSYDATGLARRGDVVVVTVNYRVGALGFSHLGHLDPAYEGSGNAGLRDQIAALHWVRDNIAAFGGDPGCVTIFGQSAGGHSVGCLLVCPEAAGLFHRAIAQSSAAFGLRSMSWAEEVTAKLMAESGVESVGELRTMGIDALLAVQTGLGMRSDQGGDRPRAGGVAAFPFAPVLDGVVIRGAVIDEVAAGRAPEVPLLICHTRDECKLFRAMGVLESPRDEHDLVDRLGRTLPDGRAALEAYRRAQPDASISDLFVSFVTDLVYHMPDFRLADVRGANDPRVWMATVAWGSSADGDTFGACHGMDIRFLFDGRSPLDPVLGKEPPPRDLVDSMQDAWVTFARRGDPNCTSLPTWPRYNTDQRAVMILDTTPTVRPDPEADVRILWDSVVL